MFHLQIWQKRRIVNSTKPTIRRLNFCDIYFLKISVHVCISVAQQENAAAILPKIWKNPCSSLGEQGLSSMEKRKNFRVFCARKALRTLRSTQCPQNWLTMMAGSANFEDRENFLTVVLLCCKSVCDPSAHIFTIISLFYSASTIGIEPELCFSKCCISDMAWPTYLPLCQWLHIFIHIRQDIGNDSNRSAAVILVVNANQTLFLYGKQYIALTQASKSLTLAFTATFSKAAVFLYRGRDNSQ